MKWGVRRNRTINSSGGNIQKKIQEINAKNEVYRNKMARIAENKNANKIDRMLARYGSQPVYKKATRAMYKEAASQLVKDTLSGKTPSTPEDYGKLACKVAMKTLKNMTVKELASRTVSTKYDDYGNRR